MTWTHYTLKFRLLSPMHIGYRKVGNLMQTRNYVPGKNLWAALTARLTRDCSNRSGTRGYEEVGDHVREQFRPGYLWPSLDGKKPCLPWERKDFEYLFLDSYGSAALDYSAYSTEKGSLHETEFIAPVARNEMPVYLMADLWAKDGQIEAKDWQEAMKNLQFGGERTYGWGRLALCSDWEGNNSGHGKTSADQAWLDKDGKITLSLSKGHKITAHALACVEGAAEERTVSGPVEPLVGREWNDHAGQHLPSYGGVWFVPGCEVKEASEFEIDSYGRWKSYRR
jgi:hypothetical protein